MYALTRGSSQAERKASLWQRRLRRPKYQSTNFQPAARQVVLAAVLWRSGLVTHVRNFPSPFSLCPTGVTIYLPPATGEDFSCVLGYRPACVVTHILAGRQAWAPLALPVPIYLRLLLGKYQRVGPASRSSDASLPYNSHHLSYLLPSFLPWLNDWLTDGPRGEAASTFTFYLGMRRRCVP